jgi:hypothetical protein
MLNYFNRMNRNRIYRMSENSFHKRCHAVLIGGGGVLHGLLALSAACMGLDTIEHRQPRSNFISHANTVHRMGHLPLGALHGLQSAGVFKLIRTDLLDLIIKPACLDLLYCVLLKPQSAQAYYLKANCRFTRICYRVAHYKLLKVTYASIKGSEKVFRR